MYGPIRAIYATRPHAPLWLMACGAVVAAVFAATPFLIPEVAVRYGVSNGLAGTISVAQVGTFALTTWLLPRFTAPTPRVVRAAGVALIAANIVSALVSAFALLIIARMVAGVALGAMTWVAWADAMRAPRSMATLSATGPVTVLVGIPIIGLFADLGGDRAVYGLLAVMSLAVLGANPAIDVIARRREVSKSRSNRVLLAALTMLTFFGASLFVYEAVASREVLGLSSFMVSLGFSLNAGGGILGARLAHRHRRPGWWLATAGPAALLTVTGGAAGYLVGMTWWGFAFWMGLPGVLRMLSDRSLEPSERAGDAQSVMAVGRTLAPLAGGAFVNADAFVPLALLAGAGLTLSGLTVIGVQEGRDRLAPATHPTPVASHSPLG